MKSFNLKEKLSKGKSIYIMAATSFCLTAAAIGIIYSQTVKRTKELLPEISTTRQVNNYQSDVSDPREITVETDEEEEEVWEDIITEDIEQKQASDNEKEVVVTTEKSEATTRASTESEETATTSASVSVIASQTFIRPHDGEIIRAYSPDIPVYCETMNDWRTHSGIDIAVKEGDEAVSVGKGKVSKVIVDASYGYTVEVDYGSFTARYCGLRQGESVGIGQSLEKGDSVGVIDSVPCEAKSGPHLHFEIIKDGMDTDPIKAIG